MRFTRLHWGACVALGLLLGFAAAAQRSGLTNRIAELWTSTARGSEPQDKETTSPVPPQQPIEALLKPEPPFKGQIDRIATKSKADFPKEVKAPAGAPNVLLILTDDVGFGAASTFGGPIPTPTMEKLASRGIKYNR